MKLGDWLWRCSEDFRAVGLEFPLSEAEILGAEVLGLSRPALLVSDESSLEAATLGILNAAKLRRLKGEPLAYILGFKDFYRARFLVGPGVLIPRPETELIVELALDKIRSAERVVDFGAGSGAIGLSISIERPAAEVSLVESSAEALTYLERNCERLTVKANVFHSSVVDFSSQSEHLGEFDLVVANPPYIDPNSVDIEPAVVSYEPHSALFAGEAGLAAHRVFIKAAWLILRKGGWYISEIGHDQANQVKALLSDFQHVEIKKDLAGLDRVVVARR